MAWAAELLSVTKNEGNIVAAVRFADKDTGEQFERSIPGQDLTPENLASFCQRVIEGLEKRDAGFGAFAAGPITLPRDATDQATKDKIAAAAAADAFFVLLRNYNELLAQVEKGIIQANDQSVTDAATAMKAAFLPEYASDPRFR